jgi:hypothetical protein
VGFDDQVPGPLQHDASYFDEVGVVVYDEDLGHGVLLSGDMKVVVTYIT